MFKVNNRNTRTRCEICSKLTVKTPERHHWSYFMLVMNSRLSRILLKTEKSIVIEKKNYPPIAFVDDINSITSTVAKSVFLNCFAKEFQKIKRLQFNVLKCKILPISPQLKSCDIYKLSLSNEDMQIEDTVTYLGEKFHSEGNNPLLVQCVESKARASFSEIISLGKTITNQHHHLYISSGMLIFTYRIKPYMDANHHQICLQPKLIL